MKKKKEEDNLWDSLSHPAKVSPVQEITEALSSIPLDDPLAPALLAELEQKGGELVARLVNPTVSPVEDVNACDWKGHDVKYCNTYFASSFQKSNWRSSSFRKCTHHMLRDPLCVPP